MTTIICASDGFDRKGDKNAEESVAVNENVLLVSLLFAGWLFVKIAAVLQQRSDNRKEMADPAGFAGLALFAVAVCVGLAIALN